MYQKEFENIGLTKGESKVYSYLLKTGEKTTGPIVKNSKVAYSKVYQILERLMQKGLISFIIKNKTKHYKALQPSRLTEYIQNEKIQIQNKERLLAGLLPKLEGLKEDSGSSAEVYIGINGVKTAYENLIKNSKKNETIKYFYYYNPRTYDRINDFYYQLFPTFKKLKISLNGIANEKFREKFHEEQPPKFSKTKFVNFPIPSNIDILSNKILITIWEESPTAILITSEEVSNSFTEYFDNAWKTAKN